MPVQLVIYPSKTYFKAHVVHMMPGTHHPQGWAFRGAKLSTCPEQQQDHINDMDHGMFQQASILDYVSHQIFSMDA